MSGLNPLAAFAQQAVANAQASMEEAILSLGSDAATIISQVNVGDVVAATVLAPQGGSDLLQFLGQTVNAQIPPGINPGETMLLQVTGFTNNAIIVKSLGVADPDTPVPTVTVEPPPQEPGAAQSALLITSDSPQPAAAPVPSAAPVPATAPAIPLASAPPAPATPSDVQAPALPQDLQLQSTAIAPPPQRVPVVPPANVAPPRSVFVAASVRANAPQPPSAQRAAVSGADAEDAERVARSDVEARIDVLRASSSTPQTAAVYAQAAARAQQPRGIPVAPPIVRDVSGEIAVPEETTTAAASQLPAPVQRAALPQTPEAALLTRLGVPVTPTTLAAARTLSTATRALTTAYEQLEDALGKLAPESAGALRSMLAFVARFDLRSTSALPEQIATYVSDVLDGAEAKIAKAVALWESLAPAEVPEEALAEAAPAATAEATTVAAQAIERAAAMEYDVKAQILTMIEQTSPAAGATVATAPQLASALRDALTATTAVQLNALNAQSSDPRTIAIPLPAYFYEGGDPVHMRISRDAPDGKKPLDPDNFHIAFILDTKTLGTVAIDVQTVGRSVSVDVKTQASAAAGRFSATLGDLRSRLEGLRYTVASIIAGVAPAGGTQPPPHPTNAPTPNERKSLWDLRA
jgi:hypothetical protein